MPRKAPLHEANGSSNVLIGIPVMPFEQRWHILVGYIELSPQLFFFGPGFGRNHTMIYIQMVPWVVVIIYSNLCSLYVMWVKQGEGASKRPCVSAHGYISIQWCSKVSPQRERFFTDIYILWVCQKSWKGMEKWVTVWFQWFLWDESHHVGKDSCTLFLLQRSIYIYIYLLKSNINFLHGVEQNTIY